MIRAASCVLHASVLLLALAGCTRRSDSPQGTPAPAGGEVEGSSEVRIGMLPKLIGIPYFNVCEEGAREAAEELGAVLEYNGPTEADAVRQAELVKSWIHRGFDAIAVAPNNPESIAGVLRQARDKGIHVVTWDTDSLPEAREVFCNQVGYDSMATTLVDIVSEATSGDARVALISGTETAANQNTWMGLMRKYAAAKHPGVTFIDPVEYPGEDEARAYQSAKGLLKRPEPPDAIIGMTTVAAPAAARAVLDAGLSGKVVVTGITLPSMMRRFVESGTVDRFVLWDPKDFGYLTVQAAYRLASSGDPGEEIDCGRLGKRKVTDGEVVLGDPLVIGKDNIAKLEF